MMRSPNGSSSLRPTTAWQATPAWRQRVATSPTILPCSVCSSSGPRRSPRRPRPRIRSSKPIASST